MTETLNTSGNTILPTLYKKSTNGAIQTWTISHEGNSYTVEYGQLGGKMRTETSACVGKSLGKSNETTGEEQAKLEAQAKWRLRQKKGYTTSEDGSVSVSLPQRVRVYTDFRQAAHEESGYSTPKLNGINGTYRADGRGGLILTSRGGEEYPPIPHLEPYIRKAMDLFGQCELNGELYIHGEHLQDISSAVRATKASSARLTFHVFELPQWDVPYEDKVSVMLSVGAEIEKLSDGKVSVVTPTPIQSPEEADTCYEKAMSDGCEGTVIYLKSARYRHNFTNTKVFKYKIAKEGEYKVTGYSTDKKGHVVYECLSGSGADVFRVKRKGTNEERTQDAAEAQSNVGRWLTIEYETLSKGGTPLKPVGLDFRKCNSTGQPQE